MEETTRRHGMWPSAGVNADGVLRIGLDGVVPATMTVGNGRAFLEPTGPAATGGIVCKEMTREEWAGFRERVDRAWAHFDAR